MIYSPRSPLLLHVVTPAFIWSHNIEHFSRGSVEVNKRDTESFVDEISATFDRDEASEILIDFSGRFLSCTATKTFGCSLD
jgi:hypothetical protein